MPNRKAIKSAGGKATQQRRTHRNQLKKYEKLLRENPGHKDRKIWEKQRDYFSN